MGRDISNAGSLSQRASPGVHKTRINCIILFSRSLFRTERNAKCYADPKHLSRLSPWIKTEARSFSTNGIYYTNLFSIEFAACSNSSKLIQVLSALNKRKPAEKSRASAADAVLNYRMVQTEISLKPLGQTHRWALLPVSAEGFLPLLAACSISRSPQSSPPVSNYTTQSTLRPPPLLFLSPTPPPSLFFSFSFPSKKMLVESD